MLESKKIHIDSYNSEIEVVSSIRALIRDKYEHLFFAVIVHGSVASDEIVSYSDFDGLLIVKDDHINSESLKNFKKESMRMILKFDPLQHHGWFQIKESELNQYPQHYLPLEILEHSKLMFPFSENLSLDIKVDFEAVDYKRSLKQLLSSIDLQAKSKEATHRLYDFKSFLSKIMLIPSMYHAAKHDEGIYKKFSFEAVKPHFSSEAWHCIEVASAIRMNWDYELSKFQRFIMTMPWRPFRRITKKLISPKTQSHVLDKMDDSFFNSLQVLINTINKDIFVA